MKKFGLLLLILALFFAIGNIGILCGQDNEEMQVLTLYVGAMKSVAVNTPTRVVIGNPTVADIISVTTKEIMLAGKGAGATNLIWWDSSGEKSMRLKVLTEDMSDVKSRIDDLLKELNLSEVSSRTADSEGKVLLLGTVKTKEEFDRIRIALGPLYAKTTNLIQTQEEKAIVELDVEVLEVNKDATKELGMKWFDSASAAGDITLTEPDRWEKKLATIPDAVFRVSQWTHTALVSTLSLLVQEGKARILSRPRLACQSGKEAELLVGGEKPIMTTSTVSGGGSSTGVEYKEYGIKLRMAPEVKEDKKIKLALNVEVSDVGTVETLGSAAEPTAKAYPLSKRSTSTQLYLSNGQTLSISGLIKQKSEEDLQKIPWLGDVPVLGLFFRHKSSKQGGGSGERGDTELVILVTPSILSDKQQDIEEMIKEKRAGIKNKAINKPMAAPKTADGPLIEEENKQAPLEIPAAPVQAVPTEVTADQLKEQVLAAYIREVAEYIESKLEYPWAARQAKIEGAVGLTMHLSESGELLAVGIESSSNSGLLDENTIRVAKQISPYPSFPQGITEEDLWIQVPIVYNLEE
jgi:pilus assembly protein CpaC